MGRTSALVGGIFLFLATSPGLRAGDPKFTLAFDGYPAIVRGEPGETKRFEIFVTLTGEGLSDLEGAEGWSLSTVVEGEGVASFRPDLKGIKVSTVFDHDQDPATSPLDPHELDLSQAGFKATYLGFSRNDPRGLDPRIHGASAAIVLGLNAFTILRPETQGILKLSVEVAMPREKGCVPLEFRFEDGGGTNGNINNVVTAAGLRSFLPETTSATVLLCTPPHFRRGDSNADGQADISDPITTLGFLFQGGPTPGCLDALDVNNDGALDLSDPIFFLQDFFMNPYSWSFIPQPGPFDCGEDPPKDEFDPLTCESFPPCGGA